jgi:hypothetical protein
MNRDNHIHKYKEITLGTIGRNNKLSHQATSGFYSAILIEKFMEKKAICNTSIKLWV